VVTGWTETRGTVNRVGGVKKPASSTIGTDCTKEEADVKGDGMNACAAGFTPAGRVTIEPAGEIERQGDPQTFATSEVALHSVKLHPARQVPAGPGDGA
jgi:hypothetical protein